MNCKFLLTGAMVLSLGTVPFTYAADQKSDQDRFTQQRGSEMGVPEPGSIRSDQETTKKQRDPSKHQRADQNAQVTLGGAKYVVYGGIRNIQGDYYFINDEESGDEVRLLVNNDTNLDCSAAESSTRNGSLSQVVATDRLSAEQHGGEASDRQKEQGQNKDETAVGSGFRIGTCSFRPGDRIKAEVDDMGRVTTLRSMPSTGRAEPQTARSLGEAAGTGELAIPGKQDKPGQLDMTSPQGYPPKQYALLPVPLGKFITVSQHALLNSSVCTPDGKIVGSLETLIMDSETGQIEYVVVLVHDTNRLEVAPWARFKIERDRDEMKLVLNTNQYQLSPGITETDMADRSPDLEKLVKDMESTRAPADLREDEDSTKKSVSKNKPSPDVCASKDCHVIRGRVLKLEGDSFMVKENSGSKKEVRMTVDRKTQKGQVGTAGRDEEFAVGDTIEAYVTSTGHAESISLMRPHSAGRPEEIGG
jgi:sporulation protein YlmC with PRC-barrel domain